MTSVKWEAEIRKWEVGSGEVTGVRQEVKEGKRKYAMSSVKYEEIQY